MESRSQVAILAGGYGTRLSARAGGIPKPMVPIAGKPVLQHQVELCRHFGFTNIAMFVHHQHEAITGFFGDGSRFGVNVRYVIEEVPKGTAGALSSSLSVLAPQFLVLYGDTFLDINLRKIWDNHKLSGAAATLLLHPNDHPQDSDLVEVDSDNRILSILSYPHPSDREIRNLVNAALYVLQRSELENLPITAEKRDIARDLFPDLLKQGRRLNGYVTPEYIKDMGTPHRLDKVEREFIAGVPDRLSDRSLRSAVFIDRDGTLIYERNHLIAPSEVELLPDSATAVRHLNQAGTLAVVVTNQPVIARGAINEKDLNQIHARLDFLLGADGAYLNALYFCPHHPDMGFEGEVKSLKGPCDCRKPGTGLIDRACSELAIDRRSSWLIGDTTSDIEAGRRAGLRTILVRTGHAGSDAKFSSKPDYVCRTLSDAVNWVLHGHSYMHRKLAPIAAQIDLGNRLVLIGGAARSGKSFSGQVLKELLSSFGRKAHLVCLDGWLKPKNGRKEGSGVCERYSLSDATAAIMSVIHSESREILFEPIYDRKAQSAGMTSIVHSIGPQDIIIVEGVPALLIDDLIKIPNTVKIYSHASRTERYARFISDYVWRGYSKEKCEELFAMREIDEFQEVMQSQGVADFVVGQSVEMEAR